MGEYLRLVSKEGFKFRQDPQKFGSAKIKLVDKRIKLLVKKYFKNFPNVIEDLQVINGEIHTKLATCETIFFTFEEILAIQSFIEKYEKFFTLDMEGNSTPLEILNNRTSLYLGRYNSKKKVIKLKVADKNGIEHSTIWKKGRIVKSKNKKLYWKKFTGSETSGCSNNPNGKLFPCPYNGLETFKVSVEGFGYDLQKNRGRDLYRCVKCNTLFNNGEYPIKREILLKKAEVSL